MFEMEKNGAIFDGRQRPMSSMMAAAPSLSRRGLTSLLVLMCIVPIGTVTVLQITMPPVKPNTLTAQVSMVDVPPPIYYERDLEDRLIFPDATLVVKNMGQQAWTHLNIRINGGHYQVYEHAAPLEPGHERSYLLNRFVNRSGAVFQVGITRPDSVEIYARLPDKSRGTYEGDLN